MTQKRILVVDDDSNVRGALRVTLKGDYAVSEARDGQEALKSIYKRPPDLVILDLLMPNMDGFKVCQILRKDPILRHLPVMILTGQAEIDDKVGGIEAGADDYLVKPFEPTELVARIKMLLRRSQRDLNANPLTKLPGNISIFNEIQSRIDKGELFAICYIDLDKFKIFNDEFGYIMGDRIICQTADILQKALEELDNPRGFVGHIGGDDFVVITVPAVVDSFCSKVIHDFDSFIPTVYNKATLERGYIIGHDREGRIVKTPLLSISIAVVTNQFRKISHKGQVDQIGTELKRYAKSLPGSNYVKDRRKNFIG